VRPAKAAQLEATLQRILNEYPSASLERIVDWGNGGQLQHSWGACLNAAAVGHGIDGAYDVEEELGIPAFLAEGLAQFWDRLGDLDPYQRRVCTLAAEILSARGRKAARAQTGFGPGAALPGSDTLLVRRR